MGIKEHSTNQFAGLASDKQNQIIDASIEEFSRRGYADASVNTIVKQAGISKGSLFNYFKSKEGLFGYIYELAFNEVKTYLVRVRDETESEEFFARLARLMSAGVVFIRQHPRLARVYFRIQNTGDAPYGKTIIQELHKEALKYLRSLVTTGIERGELRSDLNIDCTAFMLESILNRLLQAHYLDVLDPDLGMIEADAQSSAEWISNLVETIRTGLE